MRISDWSSDVCSSDLDAHGAILANTLVERNVAICAWRYTASQSNLGCAHDPQNASRPPAMLSNAGKQGVAVFGPPLHALNANVCRKYGETIGRESCRDRVCRYG